RRGRGRGARPRHPIVPDAPRLVRRDCQEGREMMIIVRKGLHRAVAAALLLAGTAGWAAPPFRQTATPGVRHYRYTVVQTINHTIQRGYRVDFDLASGADGSLDAILLSSEALADG